MSEEKKQVQYILDDLVRKWVARGDIATYFGVPLLGLTKYELIAVCQECNEQLRKAYTL